MPSSLTWLSVPVRTARRVSGPSSTEQGHICSLQCAEGSQHISHVPGLWQLRARPFTSPDLASPRSPHVHPRMHQTWERGTGAFPTAASAPEIPSPSPEQPAGQARGSPAPTGPPRSGLRVPRDTDSHSGAKVPYQQWCDRRRLEFLAAATPHVGNPWSPL